MAIKDFKTRKIFHPTEKYMTFERPLIVGQEGTIIFKNEGYPPHDLKVYSIGAAQIHWYDDVSKDTFVWRTSDGRPLDISLQKELDEFLENQHLGKQEIKYQKIIQKIVKLAEEQEEE